MSASEVAENATWMRLIFALEVAEHSMDNLGKDTMAQPEEHDYPESFSLDEENVEEID